MVKVNNIIKHYKMREKDNSLVPNNNQKQLTLRGTFKKFVD